jgi:hypothetical protein
MSRMRKNWRMDILRPTVIVGISDDEAGKSKEEIDCQIRVAYQTQGSVPTKRIIEEVKDDNQKCRATSQAIQDLKVFLAAACPVGVDSTICFSSHRVHRLVNSIRVAAAL